MAENTADKDEETPPKGKSKSLLIGIIMAIIFGAGGFYAGYSGLIMGGSEGDSHAKDTHDGGDKHHGASDSDDIAFVPIDPLIISLGQGSASRHLRFNAQLEVKAGSESSVAHLMPRVLDVLNGYLRAVDLSDVETPAALVKLRAQMLRRIQIVTGEDQVNDLLITEFVLN